MAVAVVGGSFFMLVFSSLSAALDWFVDTFEICSETFWEFAVPLLLGMYVVCAGYVFVRYFIYKVRGR